MIDELEEPHLVADRPQPLGERLLTGTALGPVGQRYDGDLAERHRRYGSEADPSEFVFPLVTRKYPCYKESHERDPALPHDAAARDGRGDPGAHPAGGLRGLARPALRPGDPRRGRRGRRCQPPDGHSALRLQGRSRAGHRRLAATDRGGSPRRRPGGHRHGRAPSGRSLRDDGRRERAPPRAGGQGVAGRPPSQRSAIQPPGLDRTHASRRGSTGCRGARREELVLALYAATDVTVWKLLRRDLGSSRSRTESIIRQLVEGALGTLTITTNKETS